MADELTELRAEIARVVADALAADHRHVTDTERRDVLHVNELERRDELHIDETAARDDAHLAETAKRDGAHLHELQLRSELHAEEVANIRKALDTRDLIGQAKGVMMALMGCSPEDAFDLIVKQSQHENRKAADIAAEIVQRLLKRPG
jgi:hypothetical protein